ncbi:LysR family transcriptional regulator [Caulobacter soli]|uniref:LysR family transcriptional regulator n=1 Tax=Caulobacter soli TaxID=2708539 RepID=UPI0013EA71C8|nr:LysR family transcriptional regulator [Caulobacter soli]
MKSSLLELEAVVTVARRGGFRAAARELDMSSSALSHAVAALEARLGVRLFNRTTRSVSLSSAGERFVAEVTPALAAIRAAMEGVDAQRDEPSGTLRINTSLGAARMILEPLVLEYLRRWPKAKVDLVTEGALIDIVGQGFDAGVRLAEFVPADMIAVPINRTLRSLVVGSPAYFTGRERPRTPADLMAHRCVRARMASGAIYHWEFERHGESLTVDPPGALILDESGLMLTAALAGQGLAMLSETSAAPYLADGRLEAVLEDWTPPYPGLCLYYPGRRNMPASLRAFVALIRERIDG